MANRDLMQDDYEGFIDVPQLQNDQMQEASPAIDRGTDAPNPFTFTPLQFSPMPAGNLYGYQENLSSASVTDLNIATNVGDYPMNFSVDKDVIVFDDTPILDNQDFSFDSIAMDSMSSGYQIPNDVTTSYRGMSRVPHFENVGAIDRNSINAVYHGAGNFNLDAETQNNIRQPTGHYRNIANFSNTAAHVRQSTFPGVYDNQVRANLSQPNRLDTLDGRFLSLGNVASYMNSNTYGGNATHMTQTSLSLHGQSTYNSFNSVRGLSGFQNNADGLMTTSDNQNFSRHDINPICNPYGRPVNMHHYSGRTSEAGNETNSSMYASDPSEVSRLNQRMITNISTHNQGLVKNLKGRVQRVPFNSTVLKSNHQIAADPVQNSYHATNIMLPPGIGDSNNHNISGLALGSCMTSSAVQASGDNLVPKSSIFLSAGEGVSQFSSGLPPAGQNNPPYTRHGRRSTGQTAEFTVKNEHPQASRAVDRNSLKRNLLPHDFIQDQRRKIMPQTSVQQFSPDLCIGQTAEFTVKNEHPQASRAVDRNSLKQNLPPHDFIQDQCRKIMPQTSVQQFSPDLLHNALGQIATTGHTMPACTTTVNSSILPSAAQRESAASDCSRNTTPFYLDVKIDGAANTAKATKHPTTSAADFISPTDISATLSTSAEIYLDIPSSKTSSPAAPANTSTAAMVAVESPTIVSPPMDAPSTPLARKMADRSGSAGTTNSQRVAAAAAALSSSGLNTAALTALRKAHLLQTRSNMTRPSLSDWKKSLPALAALAKKAPGVRASQVSSSMHHIKFQGFDLPPTVGFKCLLCKRDLSFAPEGPISQPPIPPMVATLPCGHTFHDHCLLLITPEDQSKDPPCIPCAMGET